MRKLRVALAVVPAAVSLLLAGACHQKPSAIVLSMSVPQGLLDDAQVTLRVIGEGAECNETTGRVSGSFDVDSIQEFTLGTSGCAEGAVFCQDITIEQGEETKTFEVEAIRNQERIAGGCTAVVVDQDPLNVDISVVPFVADKCCNDGLLQVGEQCDLGVVAETGCNGEPTGGAQCTATVEDFVCQCDCLAREIVLSDAGTLDPMLGNAPGAKLEPAFAFAGGNAEGDIPSSFRAVFTDTEGGININQRILTADLQRPDGLIGQQLRLPQDCERTASAVGPGLDQSQPDITRINDDIMLVAFSDNRETPGAPEIRVLAQNAWGCNDTSPPALTSCPACTTPPCDSLCPPTKVGTVGSGVEQFPSLSASNGRALVVWVNGSSLRGRVWQAGADSDCSTCLPADEINFGKDIQGRPRVTANNNGFLVSYAFADDIFVRVVDIDGNLGGETKVNAVDGKHGEPAIASLADGRFVVVWKTDGVIRFQRFGATGAIAGDQDVTLSVESPAGGTPVVAAAGNVGQFYTAAWATDDGTIWARHIGTTSRFLRNSVNGRLDDFLASHPGIVGQRFTPDVAIGGNGWVAIGWVDFAPDPSVPGQGQGVRVRRFPLPEE